MNSMWTQNYIIPSEPDLVLSQPSELNLRSTYVSLHKLYLLLTQ